MKQRIVKQLDLLAHDITHAPYRKPLCEAFSCSENRLQQTAQTVLYQLLHDFSAFNISTIDSFSNRYCVHLHKKQAYREASM